MAASRRGGRPSGRINGAGWPSGKASGSYPEDHGFDPRPRYTVRGALVDLRLAGVLPGESRPQRSIYRGEHGVIPGGAVG